MATLEQLLEVYERSVLEQSDHLLAEQGRLRLQTTLLECQGEASPDGILSVGSDGRILFANRHLSQMWAMEPPVVGAPARPVLLHTLADKLDDAEGFIAAADTGDLDTELRLELALHDGRCFDFHVAPIRDGQGCMLGRMLQFRDISTFKEVDRMKDEFISAVSHELRTPLTSIRGALDLISSGVMGDIPEEAIALTKIAQSNCRRLVRLVSDVLDIEKIEVGRMEFNRETLGLASQVGQAVESMRPYGAEYSVHFEFRDRAPGALVSADPDRLAQVMENLLSNAAKFSPRDGVVSVELERVAESLRISVTDRGPGIPPEFHGRVFEKFSQIPSAASKRSEGTGLGLNIARAIVVQLGGRIGFRSAPGVGSTFFVDLPEWSPGAGSESTR